MTPVPTKVVTFATLELTAIGNSVGVILPREAAGLRDAALLDSALTPPPNHAAHGEPDLAELAALYAMGIARNHPFIDGNKRTAYVAMELFLDANGCDFAAGDADCVLTMLRMAAGEMSDAAFIGWVRGETRPRG